MSYTNEMPTVEQQTFPATRQKTTIFQKYMIIRLNEILFRKQIRNAFNKLLEIKPIEQMQITTRSTTQKEETKYYTVQLEIIRPKIRGNVVFNKTFNVSDLKIPKKINKFYITKPSESIAQFETENNEKESNTKIQDLKQLIKFQKSLKDIQLNQQKAKPQQKQIEIYQILILVFVLCILCLTL